MPHLTLYHAVTTSSATSIHILLLHLGIPFTPVPLQLYPTGYASAHDDGASLSHEQYKAIGHPDGYVPALAISDPDAAPGTRPDVLTEAPAIITYVCALAASKPDPPPQHASLLGIPGDALHRARVVEAMNWLSGTVHGMGVALVFRQMRFSDDEASYPSLEAKGRALLEDYFARIDARYKEHGFMAGPGGETAADFYAYIFWRMGFWSGFDMHAIGPNFGQAAKRMEAKEAVRQAIEAEGTKLTFPHEVT
jgi:glutathione S-transferase